MFTSIKTRYNNCVASVSRFNAKHNPVARTLHHIDCLEAIINGMQKDIDDLEAGMACASSECDELDGRIEELNDTIQGFTYIDEQNLSDCVEDTIRQQVRDGDYQSEDEVSTAIDQAIADLDLDSMIETAAEEAVSQADLNDQVLNALTEGGVSIDVSFSRC